VVLFLAAIAVLLLSSFGAFVSLRSPRLATGLGATGAVLGCSLGIAAAIRGLLGHSPESISLAWTIPYGSFSLQLDALSSLFLILIFTISGLGSIYGAEYFAPHAKTRPLGSTWAFYNLLIASMALVVTARNGILFLMVWEVMALSSFFLVIFDRERDRVRHAGLIYLVATHLGTAFLLTFFIIAGSHAQSLDFDRFESVLSTLPPASSGLLFVLALIGFGSKAGFMPFHVWLPEAHPVAPSHVSALMSGVMIKTGIYGLIRTLTFLGEPSPWWGLSLVTIGIISTIGGILFAVPQHDLKRLLAYSSVENIGIIGLGLGLALIGAAHGSSIIFALGLAGAIFHVINHAVYKSLLFLGAGAILHATGTLQLDKMGGLVKRSPYLAFAFFIGVLAICGLPPLNGLASEFLIYMGSLNGGMPLKAISPIPFIGIIIALSFAGGLAMIAFTSAFGTAFLGTPRTETTADAHAPGWALQGPIAFLALLTAALGFLSPWVFKGILSLLRRVPFSSIPSQDFATAAAAAEQTAMGPLLHVTGGGIALILFIAVLVWVRRRLLSGRSVTENVTWDCGFMHPNERMQYTSSSFQQPTREFFHMFLRSKRRKPVIVSHFPMASDFETETRDVFLEHGYQRFFSWIERGVSVFRRFQHGRMQIYVLYVLVTLIFLLVWLLGLPT